ncbi:MAG: D-alanyl-D-alanine carboxypeptidase [Clostridia bacterium]|nr:D-alanyl-D-alanine carboxypeptidase [Clostridia bacterium]
MHNLLKKLFFISSIITISLYNFVYAYELEYEEDSVNINETIQETSTNPLAIPTISSKSAVVIDRNSNTVLYGKNENEVRKMASTTKIMTSLVVIENCNLEDTVIVSKKAAGTGGSRLGLNTNDKITVKNLLYGLMLCSGNDTAVALAEYVGGSIEGFADLMNKKASDLGLKNTHFVTPHGLDSDNHYTTAFELAYLTNYALNNDIFAKIVNTKTITISINNTSKSINNTNELLGVLNGVYGVKTGFTNGANRCLVTSCKRDNLDIICVVLGADTKKIRTQDSIKLIEYAFSNYTTIDIHSLAYARFDNWINNEFDFEVKKSSAKISSLKLNNFPYKKIAIPKDQINNINIFIETQSNIEAPIYSNTKIGYLDIIINENTLCRIDIVNENDIPKRSIIDYFSIFFKNYYSIILRKYC